MTYNNILDLFKTMAENHHQIKSFGRGAKSEIDAQTNLYPLLFVYTVDANTKGLTGGSTMLIYRFLVCCMDLVQKDRSNEQEVLSDTLRILLDIVAEVKRNSFDYELSGEVKFTPFLERFADDTSGWWAELLVEVPAELDPCAVPEN